MKKLIFIVMLGLSTIGFSGPVVEIYECQINKGKTLEDLSNMMDTFSAYLKKAGLNLELFINKLKYLGLEIL